MSLLRPNLKKQPLLCKLFIRLVAIGIVWGFMLGWFAAHAAPVTIESAILSTDITAHNGTSPTTVFLSNETGYTFYINSSNEAVYKKTVDGGSTWSSEVVVSSLPSALHVAIWYDRWTPGNTSGNIIHIVVMGSTGLYYRALDTSNDSFTVALTNATTNSSQTPSFIAAGSNIALTVATDGTIYTGSSDTSDSFIVECSASCGTTTSWTETGTSPLDLDYDQIALMPLAGGDIMIIREDINPGDMDSNVYNGTAWQGWVQIDTLGSISVFYDGPFGATVNLSNNDIYLTYVADFGQFGTDDDVRTAIYSGGSWTLKANVVTNDIKGITGAKIGYDEKNDNIYVLYTGRTTPGTATTANAYYKVSTDGMTTWGSEQGPINSSPDDIWGARINIMSSGRLYATWVEFTEYDLYGETIGDFNNPIDINATVNETKSLGTSPKTVFVSDTQGYAFYFESDNGCDYRKTTDGGRTWSTTSTAVGPAVCRRVAVWYDQWTPGDNSGNYIYILSMDASDLYISRLNTANDTLAGPANITSTKQGGSYLASVNVISATKSTDNYLYVAAFDTDDSFVLRCSLAANCLSIGNWTEVGSVSDWSLDVDWPLLMPLPNGDIMLINNDVSANLGAGAVDARIYDTSLGSWGSWTNIINTFYDNANYIASMGAALVKGTNDIYFVATHNVTTLGSNDDILTRKWVQASGAWQVATDVLTNDSKGLTDAKIAVDQNTGNVFVVYTGETSPPVDNTANIYYRKSTNGMLSWGSEVGPLDTATSLISGINVNIVDDERIYATWFENATEDFFGITIENLTPPSSDTSQANLTIGGAALAIKSVPVSIEDFGSAAVTPVGTSITFFHTLGSTIEYTDFRNTGAAYTVYVQSTDAELSGGSETISYDKIGVHASGQYPALSSTNGDCSIDTTVNSNFSFFSGHTTISRPVVLITATATGASSAKMRHCAFKPVFKVKIPNGSSIATPGTYNLTLTLTII